MRKAFRQFTPLRESGSPRSAPTRGGRVYKDVTIIKAGLGNRKDRNYYPPNVLKEAVQAGQFEGLRAFADHPDAVSEETRPERSIRDIVGVYTNTKYQESHGGRVTGDLRVLKSSRWLSDMVDELVEMGHATNVGISINGRGQTEPKRIRLEESDEEVDANVLQKFIDLKSADVVTEAGAGGGFQQLLESARSAKESGMKFTKAEIKALREAANKGDKTAIDKLAKAAEATVEEADEKSAKKSDSKDAKDTKEAKKKKKPAVADEETEDQADPDQELDDAADDIVSAGDGTVESTDDDGDDEAGTDTDVDESDDEADGSDVDAESEDDEDEADGEGETEESDDKDVKDTKGAKKTKEAGPKILTKRKVKNVKGVPTGGGGSFTKTAGKPMKKGNKFGGAPTREAQLEAQLRHEKIRNGRLAEALRVRQQTDRARKLLRESRVPAGMRPELLHRMVGMSEQDMMREIRFTQKLLESARGSGDEHDDFDPIEGAGSSVREVRGSNRDGDDFSAMDTLLEEAGVPLREAAEDDDAE